jgi:hypothetical protein
MKIEKKIIDLAVDKVMDVAFDADTNSEAAYRIKLYRKVAWDLMKLATTMEYEAKLFNSEL